MVKRFWSGRRLLAERKHQLLGLLSAAVGMKPFLCCQHQFATDFKHSFGQSAAIKVLFSCESCLSSPTVSCHLLHKAWSCLAVSHVRGFSYSSNRHIITFKGADLFIAVQQQTLMLWWTNDWLIFDNVLVIINTLFINSLLIEDSYINSLLMIYKIFGDLNIAFFFQDFVTVNFGF